MYKSLQLSAKVVIHDDNDHCLLLKRSMSSRASPGKWDLPGGKVDAGENFEHGLLREVAEETGLTISVQRVLGAAESELPTRRVVYLILEGRIESGNVCLSSEHDDFAWVDRKDLGGVDIAQEFRPSLKAYSRIGQ